MAFYIPVMKTPIRCSFLRSRLIGNIYRYPHHLRPYTQIFIRVPHPKLYEEPKNHFYFEVAEKKVTLPDGRRKSIFYRIFGPEQNCYLNFDHFAGYSILLENQRFISQNLAF